MTTIVQLSAKDLAYGVRIGRERHDHGGTVKPTPTTLDERAGDVIGAVGEVAVCRFYGEDPERWVKAERTRGGPTPDLMHDGKSIGVKSTPLWGDHLHLSVAEYDRNERHVFVSVNVQSGRCGLHGWIGREALLLVSPEPMRHARYRSTALWRYVPMRELNPMGAAHPDLGLENVTSPSTYYKDRPDQSRAALAARSRYINALEAWARACNRKESGHVITQLRRRMNAAGDAWADACNPQGRAYD